MFSKTAQIVGGFTAFLASVATIVTVAEPYVFPHSGSDPAPVQPPGKVGGGETVALPKAPGKSDGPLQSGNGEPDAMFQKTGAAVPPLPPNVPPKAAPPGDAVPLSGEKNFTMEEGGKVSLCGVTGSFVKIWRASDGSLLDRYTFYIPKPAAGVALAKHVEIIANKGVPVEIGPACTVTVIETTTQKFPRVTLSEKRN